MPVLKFNSNDNKAQDSILSALAAVPLGSEFLGYLDPVEASFILETKKLPKGRGVADVYSEMSEEDVALAIDTAARIARQRCKQVLEYAHDAICALTINNSIDSDVTTWKMEHLAKIGLILNCRFKAEDGKEYRFDNTVTSWYTDDMQHKLNFCTDTGKPIKDETIIKGVFTF